MTLPNTPTLTVTAQNGQNVLQWSPPLYPGLVINAVQIFRGLLPGQEKFYTQVSASSPHIDRNLTNGQAYFYKIQFVTEAGAGEFSIEKSGTPTGSSGTAPTIGSVTLNSSTATVGTQLTAIANSVTGSPTPTVTWQWFYFDTVTPITGATSATYTPVGADIGHTLSAQATATNSAGTATAASAATSAVVGVTISMSKRMGLPRGWSAVGTSNVSSNRVMETNIPAAPGGVWFEDFNGFVNTNITAAADEVTAGSAGLSTYTVLSGVTGTGYAQNSATVWNATFNNIINSVVGYCYKYTAGTSPTFVARTYAQFQADGGYIVTRGNGHQINRPDGYYIRSDTSPAIAAGNLAIQTDDVRPLPITITNLTQTGGLATATVASTAGIISGCYYSITNNVPTGYNYVSSPGVQVTVISGTQFTYAVNAGTASPATTFGTFNFVRPYNASALNARGDIVKLLPIYTATAASESGTTVTVTVASTSGMVANTYYTMSGFAPSGYNGTYLVTAVTGTTFTYTAAASLGSVTTLGTAQINFVQETDWSSINGTITTNGQLTTASCGLFGLGSGGMVGVAGDSNAFNGDTNQLNPSGAYFLGDSDGAVGYIARALNGWGYSYCMTAVVGRSPAPSVTYGGGLVTRFMLRNCKTTWDEMGRNYAIQGGQTYSSMVSMMTSYYAQIRAAVSGIRIVSHTFPPITSSTDTWETGTNQTMSSPNLVYPSGWTYATYTPAQLSVAQGGNGNFNGASNGGADYVYNLQASIRNLCGAAAVDGLWAFNGTGWEATADGQHMSGPNHAYATTDLNTNYSASAILGF